MTAPKDPQKYKLWLKVQSNNQKRFWANLTPEQRKALVRKMREGYFAKHPPLTPEERIKQRKTYEKAYYQKHKKQKYKNYLRWVANNLERRRGISRESERRRAKAKKAPTLIQ